MTSRLFVLCLAFLGSGIAGAQLITVDKTKLPAPHTTAAHPSKHIGALSAAVDGIQPSDAIILELGQGYNAITGDYLPDVCVDKVRDDKVFGQTQIGAGINHEYIDVVSNMASQESSSGSSTGFDFTYKLISLGFTTGSTSSSYFNQIDQFGRVYKRLITKGEARIGGQWSSVGSTYINRPLSQFVQKCGTHYIRAIYYGSLLDQTVQFRLNQDKYGSTERSGFTLGVKNLFGFSYSDQSSQTTVHQSSKTTGTDESRGVINVVPIVSDTVGVQTLAKFAREQFPVDVKGSRPDQSALLMIEVVPYYELAVPHSERIPEWPNEIQAAIQNQAGLYEQFVSALSDLNFALGIKDDGVLAKVYKDSRTDLQNKLQAGIQIQKDFRTAAKACVDLLGKPVDDETARKSCESGLTDKLTPALVASVTATVNNGP